MTANTEAVKRRWTRFTMEAWELKDNDPARALELARTGEKHARELGVEPSVAMALHIQGVCSFNLHRLDAAESLLLQAGVKFEALGMQIQLGAARHALAGVYRKNGALDNARTCEERALRLGKSAQSTALQVAALQGLSSIALQEGEQMQGLAMQYQALALARSANEIGQEATTLQNMANTFDHLGLLEKALDCLQTAMELLSQKRNDHHLSATLLSIGKVHYNFGRKTLALEYYHRALGLCRKIGNAYGHVIALVRIGDLFAEDDRFDMALEYYRSGVRIAREADSTPLSVLAQCSLGELHLSSGNRKQAEDCLTACEMLDQELHDASISAHVQRLRTAVALRYADEKAAGSLRREALAAFAAIKDHRNAMLLHMDCAAVYSQRRHCKNGLQAYKKALAMALKGPYSEKIIIIHRELYTLYKTLGDHELAAQHMEAAFEEQRRLSAGERAAILDNAGFAEQLESLERRYESPAPAQSQTDDQRLRASLFEHYPELTPTEVKVCSLIYCHLQTKEIAATLNVTAYTISFHRQNIRRKLNVAKGAALHSALERLVKRS